MRPLHSASIANKKEHWDVGWSPGRIWWGGPVDFLYLASGQRSRPPHHVPSLRFDTCTMAPETRPWNLPILPWRRLIVQRCPMGAGGNSPTHRMGSMAIALPRSCSLCSPLPLAILRHFGRAAARYVDRSMGSPHRPGIASGTCRRSPPPLCASASDPTPNTSVKGMYSGEIESGSRPGNCDSRPRNCSSSSS